MQSMQRRFQRIEGALYIAISFHEERGRASVRPTTARSAVAQIGSFGLHVLENQVRGRRESRLLLCARRVLGSRGYPSGIRRHIISQERLRKRISERNIRIGDED